MQVKKKRISDFTTKVWLHLIKIPFAVWGFLIFVALLAAVWQIPRWQVNSISNLSQTEQATYEDKFRGTLLTGLSGLFFFVTAYFTYRNLRVTEDKQITERFGKAIEQLGSEQITVRIGGIYSLERIAKDSPPDHWTVMEVLTSFIKENSPINNDKKAEEHRYVSNDVQAALTVIGRRILNYDPKEKRLDLSLVNLNRANLFQLNLSNINFDKSFLYETDLREAKLIKSSFALAYLGNASLKEANLTGADLNWANLYCANLNGADLTSANLYYTKLFCADLSGANLRECELSRANFTDCRLTGSDLRGAKNLTLEQIKSALICKDSIFDEQFREELGLPPESTQ